MARLRQKTIILKEMAEFMISHGKELNRVEYCKLAGAPVRLAFIQTYFGTWGRMISLMKTQEPVLWDQIVNPKPKPAVEVAPVKAEVKLPPVVKPKAK